MKNKKLKTFLRDVIGNCVIGLLIGSILVGAIKANATKADTKLPKEYQMYCEEIGEEYAICPELLMAIIEWESDGNPDAVGKYGEIGLMQIYPKWHSGRAEHLKVYNLFDAEGNIRVGADYLAELFVKYGDVGTVLMVYNGVNNAEELREQGKYTVYAQEIMRRAQQLERLHEK